MEMIEASKVHETIIDYRDKATDVDSEIELERAYGANDVGELISQLPIIDAIPKDQYESRLRADLVAILEDLRLEIEELKSYESADGQDLAMLADIGILFQQKIDALKEQTDGKV